MKQIEEMEAEIVALDKRMGLFSGVIMHEIAIDDASREIINNDIKVMQSKKDWLNNEINKLKAK